MRHGAMRQSSFLWPGHVHLRAGKEIESSRLASCGQCAGPWDCGYGAAAISSNKGSNRNMFASRRYHLSLILLVRVQAPSALMKLSKTPDRGADTVVLLATRDAGRGSGGYWVDERLLACTVSCATATLLAVAQEY